MGSWWEDVELISFLISWGTMLIIKPCINIRRAKSVQVLTLNKKWSSWCSCLVSPSFSWWTLVGCFFTGTPTHPRPSQLGLCMCRLLHFFFFFLNITTYFHMCFDILSRSSPNAFLPLFGPWMGEYKILTDSVTTHTLLLHKKSIIYTEFPFGD